jgi:uncharacterized protein YbjT (DUF2867 family)
MIVVTTPTGAIGRQVLEHLLASGESVRVIARDPSRLSLSPRLRTRVGVVQGSHGDAAVVNEAFSGADAVFWVVPPSPQAESVAAAYLDFTRPACDAIRSQGVRRVVSVSALGRGVNRNAGLVSASLAMDDLIASTGVSFRALAMPSFMDNILRQVESIKNHGTFVSPIAGDRKVPMCATRDIAAVAATLLRDRSWSGQGSVPVLGPEDVSYKEMAEIMSEVLGTPVHFHQIPIKVYKARLIERGTSEAMAQGMAEMMEAKNAGLDNAEPRTPQATTPTSFRQWCEEFLKPAVLNPAVV